MKVKSCFFHIYYFFLSIQLFKRHGQEKMSMCCFPKLGHIKYFLQTLIKLLQLNRLESEVRYSAIEIVHIKFSLPLLIPHCFDSLFKVINAYMRLLVRRHNEQSKEQTFQIDTFEMTSIWNGKKSKLKVGLHCFIYVPIMKNEIQNTFQFSFFIISG